MAAKWDVDYSLKEKDLIANHPNILEDQRKQYKGLLVIKIFQVFVEVPIENPPPKTQHLVAAALKAAEGLQEIAVKEVDALAKELMDLQKEEKQGNKKAADTGKKLVEKVEKSLKKLADEFGGSIRKSAEKALIGGNKQKLMSTSRTIFRGMELDEDAFEEDIHDEIPSFFGDIVKSLVAAGNEAYKLSGEEADQRVGLVQSIKEQMEKIDKSIDDSVKRGGKGKFEMAPYVKENAKEVHKLAQVKERYVDFLKTFEEKLDTALKALDKLEKLSDKEQALKDNKTVSREYDDFRSAANVILKTFDGKLKAAGLVDDLFQSDWKNGASFVAACRNLENQPSTMKSGKNMQEAGKALEKLGKA